MQVQSESCRKGNVGEMCMDSLPHSEVKIGIMDPLRDRSVGRCPISRSMRQPHAAWQSERTNKNTTRWMSVCIVQGLKCDIEVREVTSFNPCPNRENLCEESDRFTLFNPSTHSSLA